MSREKSRLDEAIDRLDDADDWEESSVNVHVHPPVKSNRPKSPLLEGFAMLPPWGRFGVVVLVVGCLTGAGLLGRLLSLWAP